MKKMGGRIKSRVISGQHVDCNTCAHFFITWDKRFPYGCRAMSFMSSNLPNKDVLELEGRDCLIYRNKESGADGKETLKVGGEKGRNRQVNVTI